MRRTATTAEVRLDSLVNRGEYFSAHYLATRLPTDLKAKDGLLARWTEEEKDGRVTPRRGLRELRDPYFGDRKYFADYDERLRDEEADSNVPAADPEWSKRLGELHGTTLRALGYDARPQELTVHRSGEDHTVQVAYADEYLIAVECGWAVDVDAALDGRALHPVQVEPNEVVDEPTKVASWLLAIDDPPRYVLLLAGGVIVLADRSTWGEGRYLGVSLDVALGRNDRTELDVVAALFGADSLLPPAEGGEEPLADIRGKSRNHAVGVSTDLRDGLKESVELIANEVLDRICEHGVAPEDLMDPHELADRLARESLRYLYRVLFLLYAEGRPELGILPTDDPDYVQGYGLTRLGELVGRPLGGEQARTSLHLYESLDLLFRMVNRGYPPNGESTSERSDGDGLRFEALRSDLFEPEAIGLIGRNAFADDDGQGIDTRLRNETLYKVLRRLMLAKGRRNERGGFISYAQLGINQLGAVYEGLMSYTGFIATEELYEVAKNGDPKDGSWMIPASKVDEYPDEVFVRRKDEDEFRAEPERVRYREGAFVYRLAGRDRETSASYYTPESLTKVTVELALRYRLDQDGTTTSAREILGWKICEPALGSGAFLNEAINQVAAEYLRRRETELGQEIDPERREQELQRVKAYIALHNCYGVDLNSTAIELAEVSLWLNVMHPGLKAPWFGLHLRRGNSLIGAGRKVYQADRLTKGTWLNEAPDEVPFRDGNIPTGTVHHFLLPAEGWGAVAGTKGARELAPDQTERLKAWRKKIRAKVSDKKTRGRPSQLQRLQALSNRAEYLWDLVVQRLQISEREISRAIDVWGADWIDQPEHVVPREKVLSDLTATGTPFWRLKTVMDAWCALWFWPLDKADLLDGTAEVYAEEAAAEPVTSHAVEVTPAPEPTVFETTSLFAVEGEQLTLADCALSTPKSAKGGGASRRSIKGHKPRLEPLRPVIPLADLDDWLDFAEAILGRADVSPDSLATHFDDLIELEEYENQLPDWTGMDDEFRLAQRFPWLDVIEDITNIQGFFHWDLIFCQVFNAGGFDLQVGNPPWVRPDWDADSIIAEYDPWFKLAKNPPVANVKNRRIERLRNAEVMQFLLRESSFNAALTEFLVSVATYPLLDGTRPDLYRSFMCRVWWNAQLVGIAGLIHSDTHFSGDDEGRLRATAYRRLRIHGNFVNAGNWAFEIGRTREFGVHVYGSDQEIGFAHLSQLYDARTLPDSFTRSTDGEAPGQKYRGDWDRRPHRDRIVWVDQELLEEWRRFLGIQEGRVDQTPLLFLTSVSEKRAVSVLANYGNRLEEMGVRISSGYNEKTAKDRGLIRYQVGRPESLDDVILKGVHFGIATPFGREPNDPFRNPKDWIPWDLTSLASHVVPRTTYVRACSMEDYLRAQTTWHGRSGSKQRYTEFYRLAWRKMIDVKSTERSLFASIIPPGPAHIHGVFSLALEDNMSTALAAGFWASLPLDYLLRVQGRANLQDSGAKAMPAPDLNHPLASALLLRALRLNCLTNSYDGLWAELYDPQWSSDKWAAAWPDLTPLNNSAVHNPRWNRNVPLRTERERRAALVELDALVALWLGMSIDQLIAIYRGRYPILGDREDETWFDAQGRRIAADPYAYGYGQTKVQFQQFQEHLDPEIQGPPPAGYTPPFYKADREREYQEAHAEFARRLRASGWDGPIPDSGSQGGDA